MIKRYTREIVGHAKGEVLDTVHEVFRNYSRQLDETKEVMDEVTENLWSKFIVFPLIGIFTIILLSTDFSSSQSIISQIFNFFIGNSEHSYMTNYFIVISIGLLYIYFNDRAKFGFAAMLSVLPIIIIYTRIMYLIILTSIFVLFIERSDTLILHFKKLWWTEAQLLLQAIEEVNCNGLALETLPDQYKRNKQVVLKAVKQNGLALMFASELLRNDEDIVISAIQTSGESVMKYTSKEMMTNKRVIRELWYKIGTYAYASNELKENEEFAKRAILSDPISCLRKAPISIRNNREILRLAIGIDGSSLMHASDCLKEDHELVMSAITSNVNFLQYASNKLKQDECILLYAYSQNGNKKLETTDSTIISSFEKLAKEQSEEWKKVQKQRGFWFKLKCLFSK